MFLKNMKKYVFVQDLLLPFRQDQRKEGATLIFISKVEGYSGAPTNAFKWYLVIFGMPKHTQSTLISSLLPKVEAPSRLLWNALHTSEMGGHSSLLQQRRKILITEWKNYARGLLQPPATSAFNDYPKLGNSSMTFLFYLFLKTKLLWTLLHSNLSLITLHFRDFFFQPRNLQALLISLWLTYVEYW